MTVLITAASRHGATVGIADAIAGGLTKRGIDARTAAPEGSWAWTATPPW